MDRIEDNHVTFPDTQFQEGETMDIKKAIIHILRTSDHRLQPKEIEGQVAKGFGVPVSEVKKAIGELVIDGKVEYSFYGKPYLELPLSAMMTARPLLHMAR